MKAPSAMSARVEGGEGMLLERRQTAEVLSHASDPEVAPSTRLDTTTPSGRSPISERSGEKIPSTKTNRRASDTRHGVTSMRGGDRRWGIEDFAFDPLEPGESPFLLAPVGQTEGGEALAAPRRRSWSSSGAGNPATGTEGACERPGVGGDLRHAPAAWAGSISSHS